MAWAFDVSYVSSQQPSNSMQWKKAGALAEYAS